MARAIDIRMTDCGYPAGTEDALASYETSAAILVAIEALTGASILDHASAAYALWQDDPDNHVVQYLAEHYSAEEGDRLHWGNGQLKYHTAERRWM